jgi:hypothetical protein
MPASVRGCVLARARRVGTWRVRSRRMRRRLFTILSALSLPLCVATVMKWLRSY